MIIAETDSTDINDEALGRSQNSWGPPNAMHFLYMSVLLCTTSHSVSKCLLFWSKRRLDSESDE